MLGLWYGWVWLLGLGSTERRERLSGSSRLNLKKIYIYIYIKEERERIIKIKKKIDKRKMRNNLFILFDGIYHINELYVKIEIKILSEL